MAQIFHKRPDNKNHSDRKSKKDQNNELVDPILYIGGLDKERYPILPLDNQSKVEEEIENPLTKR